MHSPLWKVLPARDDFRATSRVPMAWAYTRGRQLFAGWARKITYADGVRSTLRKLAHSSGSGATQLASIDFARRSTPQSDFLEMRCVEAERWRHGEFDQKYSSRPQNNKNAKRSRQSRHYASRRTQLQGESFRKCAQPAGKDLVRRLPLLQRIRESWRTRPRRFTLAGFSIITASGAAFVVVVAVVPLSTLLKLRRHRAVGVALTVSNIDVCAVTTGDPMSAVAVASTTAIVVLPRGLFLRRKVPVWIAHAIAGAHVPTVAARRRPDGDAVLDSLNLGWSVLCHHRPDVKGERSRGNADDHDPSPSAQRMAEALNTRWTVLARLKTRVLLDGGLDGWLCRRFSCQANVTAGTTTNRSDPTISTAVMAAPKRLHLRLRVGRQG